MKKILRKLISNLIPSSSLSTPTHHLVLLVSHKILSKSICSNDMLHQGYIDGHMWSWDKKNIVVRFMTESYVDNSVPNPNTCELYFNSEIIPLSKEQVLIIGDALVKSHNWAISDMKSHKDRNKEKISQDAINHILSL